jgi:Putative zinc-finger
MGTVSKFWDEAMLVAYVDGELDAATARRLEAAIAEDPEARAQVRLLRESAAAARGAYDEILCAPVPGRLTETLARRAGGNQKILPFRRKGAAPSRLARALMPLAASLLLVALGFAGGLYAERHNGDLALELAAGPGGDARFEAALVEALGTGALGQRFDYADDAANAAGSVTVTRDFTAGFGAPCREFHHRLERMGKQASEDGIACRRADGGWEVLTLAQPSSG